MGRVPINEVEVLLAWRSVLVVSWVIRPGRLSLFSRLRRGESGVRVRTYVLPRVAFASWSHHRAFEMYHLFDVTIIFSASLKSASLKKPTKLQPSPSPPNQHDHDGAVCHPQKP